MENSQTKYSYKTPAEHKEFEIPKIKGSKFIWNIFPVHNEEDYKQALAQVQEKYWDATHTCYAVSYWVNVNFDLFGNLELTPKYFKAEDNWEPANTAGKPILSVIQWEKIHNVLITVTRYFWGTLLGIGGLIQAYSSCARESLKNTKIIEKEILTKIKISYDYEKTSQIMHLVDKYQAKILNQSCDQKAELEIEINRAFEGKFNEELSQIIY